MSNLLLHLQRMAHLYNLQQMKYL